MMKITQFKGIKKSNRDLVLFITLFGLSCFSSRVFSSPISINNKVEGSLEQNSNQDRSDINLLNKNDSVQLKQQVNQKLKSSLQTHSTAPKTYFICRSRGEVRTLRLIKKNEGICFINYTKQGVDEKVGESKSLMTCGAVIDNIKSNLESASWKCKNISSSQITEPKSIQ